MTQLSSHNMPQPNETKMASVVAEITPGLSWLMKFFRKIFQSCNPATQEEKYHQK